jgi:hypothetical protein
VKRYHFPVNQGMTLDYYESTGGQWCRFADHEAELQSKLAASQAEVRRLREALQLLYPGLVLDLRYADDDDDKDALRSRVETIESALAPQQQEKPL